MERIKPIPEEVINKIAAGEVIHRPMNVVKELIENSLDAKASEIVITVLQKGCTIKIRDNGIGIHKDDLPIICRRFTSSKISTIEDLTRLHTYGFRGEALCSMSLVAHVKISTKKRESPFGYEALYNKNEMESMKQIAANNGTVITISDLFYNMQQRRADIEVQHKSEYNKIVEVVKKYAIYCSHCSFRLENDVNRVPDVNTKNTSIMLDNIRSFYGSKVADNLICVELTDTRYSFEVEGYVNNTDSLVTKYTFILFINGRLVDCEVLKKKIQEIYTPKLMKGFFPFIFLTMRIDPKSIDVNMHPAKSQVRYLNDDIINDNIRQLIESKLLCNSDSKTLHVSTMNVSQTQATLSRSIREQEGEMEEENDTAIKKPGFRPASEIQKSTKDVTKKKVAPWRIVRNDSTIQNIKVAFRSVESKSAALDIDVDAGKLDSVLKLRQELKQDCDNSVKDLIRNSTYVGLVDPFYLLIERNHKLFKLSYVNLCQRLFYQVFLQKFGVFNKLRLPAPVTVRHLFYIHAQTTSSTDEENENVFQQILTNFQLYADMLDEYFALEFDKDTREICALPIIIEGHCPNLASLPTFIWNMQKVNWEKEKECFQSFAMAFADFYATPAFDLEKQREMTEFYLYPKMKKGLIPTGKSNYSIQNLADTADLYKVFERC